MAVARQLFGNTFGVGSRNIPPRKGLPKKTLEEGNTVNLVIRIPSAPTIDNKVREFISDQRIDLVYEEATHILSIRVVYSNVKVEAAVVSEVLKFPQLAQTPVDNNPTRRIRKVKAVPCDTIFTYNERCYTVTQSDGRRVFAVCADDGEEICFSNEELWDLILDNL